MFGPGEIGEPTVSTNTSSISLNWTSPLGEVFKYRLEWHDGGAPKIVYTNKTFAVLSDLIPGTSYTISVNAVAGDDKTEGHRHTFTSVTRPGEIGEPTVSTNTSSISLNWTSPLGEVFKYRLEWHDGGAPKIVYTNKTFAVLSDLIPGTSYTISVNAVAGDDKTEGHRHTFTSVTKPEVVRNITVTNITTSSMSVMWTKPEGNSSFYRVQWTNGIVTGSDNVTQTHKTITNLTAGVQYEITVTAVTDEGSTDGQSASVSQYTRPGEIGEPTVSTNTSSISLNWTSPLGEVFKYRLEWHDGGAPKIVYTNKTFAVLSDLIPGTSYTISVNAVAGDDKTEGHRHTFTSVTKPEVVRNITVTNITTSSMSVMWTKPEGNSSFYRVQWTNGIVTGSDNVTQTHKTITNLTAGVQYEITVTAVTDEGSTDGQSASVSQYTRPGEIGEPTVSTNTSSISLNWTSPLGEVFKYRLEWHDGGAPKIVYTNKTFAVLSDLIPGTSYTISVNAVAGDDKTEGHRHTFTSVTKPEVVRNITVTNITTSSMSVMWTKPEGNSSFYRVQWTNGIVTGSDNVTQTHKTITNLTAGVQYEITVTAVTDEGSTDGQSASVSQYTSK
ncbi:receptor-type tyrosine-protein phosphatase eta [Cebidichthys violaceus]|uniref:receptor-type tyrosine-protein phosphatase eta n=1 Tax=Cebidichthys violaceus TaxID=271503 RepID=UPI0035CB2C7F